MPAPRAGASRQAGGRRPPQATAPSHRRNASLTGAGRRAARGSRGSTARGASRSTATHQKPAARPEARRGAPRGSRQCRARPRAAPPGTRRAPPGPCPRSRPGTGAGRSPRLHHQGEGEGQEGWLLRAQTVAALLPRNWPGKGRGGCGDEGFQSSTRPCLPAGAMQGACLGRLPAQSIGSRRQRVRPHPPISSLSALLASECSRPIVPHALPMVCGRGRRRATQQQRLGGAGEEPVAAPARPSQAQQASWGPPCRAHAPTPAPVQAALQHCLI